ncbi:MAG: FKBP-type peptidyl-prolyl cis-trans isomerase [Candidatus Heimdallarchaeota archaeon]|nr:FKBP-type peptidyl-prolyl cis-trans isomerase [Candidatus Heimdallarchaeota archaeon]MBY8993428.1 FKBP-type peptidyl-prolyl cis-trans isomerase [Candidatus Heimdallarchaeota archaeon]
MAKIKTGDFLKISFTLKVKDSGQIIETTDEKVAKKANIFDEKNSYGQRLMIVGNDEMYLKKLNESIVGKDVGEKFKVSIPPEDTFGQRDSSKIKLLGRKELVAKNIIPEVGRQIQWGNQTGLVLSAVGGRVRVDFNHPLVGQTIIYDVEVLEKITGAKKRLEALLDYLLPGVDLSTLSIKNEKEMITISLPEEITTKDLYLQFRKIRIASEINKNFPECKEVLFIDSFKF